MRLPLVLLAVVLLFAAVLPRLHTPRFESFTARIRFVVAGFATDVGVVTLAQAKLNATDDIDVQIIDEFRKQSAILDAMVWHDAVSGAGAGATLTYGYTRQITQRGADFRAINSEYTPTEATKARYTVDLKPLGGSFQIDRVTANVARGAEVAFQMRELLKGTTTKFADELINGDTAVDADGFDGLDKALTGSATEINADGGLGTDWTSLGASDAAQGALDDIDLLFGLLDGPPTLLIGNDLSTAKVRAIARRANMYVEAPVLGLLDEFGAPVQRQRVGNAVLIDAGSKPGTNDRIVPVYDPDNSVWTLHLDAGADGGTFTVEISVNGGAWEETATIAFDDTIAEAELAIEANDNVGAGNVTVSGAAKDWVVTFSGDLAGQDVDVRIADDSITDGGVAPATPATVTESANTGGLTDLYAVRIGMDGFHGVAMAGQPLIQKWLPDFDRAGAVKTGEVEMGPVAVALKATKAAAVLRRIKVR